MVLKNRLLQFLLAVCFLISRSRGCGTVSKRTPLQRLQAVVQQAEERRDGDLIVLPSFGQPPSAPKSTRAINRAPVGTTANFSCTVERLFGEQMGEAAQHAPVWRHLEKIVYPKTSAPAASEPFSYSQAAIGHIHYLFIHNVSASATGHVDCFQSCNGTDPENLCIREHYDLRPKLRARDLFVSPMQNISLQYRWEFDFPCHLRHTECASSGTGPYFIWKVNEIFAIVPVGHYLYPLAHSQRILNRMVRANVSSQYYEPDTSRTPEQGSCTTTLNIRVSSTSDHPPIRVQCWVRPNPGVEEWYVQTAYATIY